MLLLILNKFFFFAGYLVFYTTDASQSDRDWLVEGVLGDKITTIVKELASQTTYYFKVQARNTMGYGPMSPTVIFRTPNGLCDKLSHLYLLNANFSFNN